jgi:hypothetical protein
MITVVGFVVAVVCFRYEDHIFDYVRSNCLNRPRCLNTGRCTCVFAKHNNYFYTLITYEENMGGKIIHLVGDMGDVENSRFLKTHPFLLV